MKNLDTTVKAYSGISVQRCKAGALVLWLKLSAWKVGDRGLVPRSGAARAVISNPMSGGQCQLIHLTILRRFYWPSLAYMCTKVA